MPQFQITIRFGSGRKGYHTVTVRAADLREAAGRAIEEISDEMAGEADLLEIRPAVDPDDRRYVGEDD